jgi:glycosyltransferase involved in cell wall biosynthesis
VPDAKGPTLAPVAIVIPAHNARETVSEAVTSVLNQTYPPARVIVVDDGSTDGTAGVVTARFGGRVDIVRQRQGGPSRARNAGLDRVTEPWVAFLDADDVWHPEKLARQWAVVARMRDVGVVACDWVRTREAWPRSLGDPVRPVPVRPRDILLLNKTPAHSPCWAAPGGGQAGDVFCAVFRGFSFVP